MANCAKYSRVDAFRQLKFPKNQKELRSVLGAVGFCRSFHPRLASILSDHTCMLKKGARVEATPAALSAFQALKAEMTSEPVLTMFDPKLPITVYCDCSETGWGAALKQKSATGEMHVVAYASGCLSSTERNWCATKRELLSCLKALRRWSHYLMGTKFQLVSDHCPLRTLMSSKNLSPCVIRHLEFLSQFDFYISYEPGRSDNLC